MTITTEIEPWDLRDAGQTIGEVARKRPLVAGDIRVALVRDPSTSQQLLDVIDLPECEWRGLGHWELSNYLEEKVEPLDVPDWTPDGPRHGTLTIVARRGFTLIGPDESRWLMGWHYCNHLKSMFTSALAVITEHGWTEFMSGLGGAEPCLA